MQRALFLAFFAVSFLIAISSADPQLFAEFQRKHGKYYASSSEYMSRYQIFVENLNAATQMNAGKTGEEAAYGITPFSDLTSEEFKSQYLMGSAALEGYTAHLASSTDNHWVPSTNQRRASIPATFDWNQNSKTVLTDVRNQGSCGSCWAFSAAENLESMAALAGYPLNYLSIQQMLDCDPNDSACNGGWPTRAYQYILNAGGLESRAAYPYVAPTVNSCQFDRSQITQSMNGWVTVTSNMDENAMATFVATQGPLSVCLDASTWSYYSGGVMTTNSNCGTSMNHCVMVTGYNVTSSGMKVWNVRNQWGTGWGINGYAQIQFGYNVCGIAQAPTAVTVNSISTPTPTPTPTPPQNCTRR